MTSQALPPLLPPLGSGRGPFRENTDSRNLRLKQLRDLASYYSVGVF